MTLRLIAALLALVITGCATVKPEGVGAEDEIRTLQADLSLALRSAGGNFSGSGYLACIFPDRCRVGLLGPFGVALMNIYSSDAMLAVELPTEKVVFAGPWDEIPAERGIEALKLLRTVLRQERLVRRGEQAAAPPENVVIDRFIPVGAAEVAGRLQVTAPAGSLEVKLDEPQLNAPVPEELLRPPRQDARVLPLSALPALIPTGEKP